MSPSEQQQCVRCGIVRMVRPGRKTSPLCIDCKGVAFDLGELATWLGAEGAA